MDEAGALPGVVERVRHMHGNGDGLRGLDAPLALEPRQGRFAIHILHRKIVDALALARRIHLHEIRVVERRRGLRLLTKAGDVFRIGGERGLEGLEGHKAIERCLPRLVHRAHPALAEAFDDFKFAKAVAFETHAGRTLWSRPVARERKTRAAWRAAERSGNPTLRRTGCFSTPRRPSSAARALGRRWWSSAASGFFRDCSSPRHCS